MINEKLKDKYGAIFIQCINIIGAIELFLGILISILLFIQAMNISEADILLSNVKSQTRTIYLISSITLFISSLIFFIFSMAIAHILENSIENRKLLIHLINIHIKKTQK